jgi:UDP-glucuronate 4-epimerase
MFDVWGGAPSCNSSLCEVNDQAKRSCSLKQFSPQGLDMKILVTGSAGFIGYHLSQRLLDAGHDVAGVDIINNYYSVQLKYDRLERLQAYSNFTFYQVDLASRELLNDVFQTENPGRVVHLAAQAGVRYSLENPMAYVDANLVAFVNLLECCRHFHVEHLVYASSSSVYGLNTAMPFSVHDNVDHPISLYAASKKSNELMAHAYSYLFQVPTTGLRFFTVYGPWGRPDMALFLFTKAILEDKPIQVYNHGNMFRDFTYIDDIVEGVSRVLDVVPTSNPDWTGQEPDPSSSPAPYRLFNIGNNRMVPLTEYIDALERALGKAAIREYLPMQPGDVPATCANIDDLQEAVGFRPDTPIETGIQRFIQWYRDYYQV